jgi:hypothetical protein
MLRFALAPLLLVPAIALAQDVSGEGDGIVVAVDPSTHAITGYYNSGTGDDGAGGPQFSCTFYLRGTAQGKPPYRITTWFPADPAHVIEGDLKFSVDAKARTVTVGLKEEHGGCWNVQHFAAKEGGATLQLETTGAWTSVRVASAKHTHFYAAPDAPQPQRSFVTTGDALTVSETRAGWVHATFTNPDNKSTSGWIREADLFAASRPEKPAQAR